MSQQLRVILSTAKYNLIAFYRIFSPTSFALRFFLPIMTMATAWILYHVIFGSENLKETFSAYSSVDYLTFIIISQAVFVYMYACIFQLGRTFYWERMGGTIEPLFLSPVSRKIFMLGHLSYAIFNASIDFVIILIAGIIVFGGKIGYLNFYTAIIGFLLLIISLFGVGLVINGITLSLRDRTNTANILTSIFFIFSGTIAPVEMLPPWGQVIGSILPLTYALHIIRGSFTPSVSTSGFTIEIICLCFISFISLIVGIIFLNRIESTLKKHGELTVF